MPQYNEIGEDERFYFIWRRHETEPLDVIPWFNMFIEIGVDKQNNRIFIRRLIYPKEQYNIETIMEIARRTAECPKCRGGVELHIPHCTVEQIYISNGTSSMEMQDRKSLFGTIAGLLLNNVSDMIHPWINPATAIVLGIAKIITKNKPGFLSEMLRGKFAEAVILGGLSKLTALKHGQSMQEPQIVKRIRSFLPFSMQGGIISRFIEKLLPPRSSMSDPRLQVPKVERIEEPIFGRRT